MEQQLLLTPWFAVTPALLLEALFVSFSIIGQEFIVRRDRRGFNFYIIGNFIAIAMFAAMGRWMSCVLYAYFIVKSIQASRNWRELERQSSAADLRAMPAPGGLVPSPSPSSTDASPQLT